MAGFKSKPAVWAGLFLALMCAFPLWAAHRFAGLQGDDFFITYTYARCLADGRGFVFNCPPATLGSTTPLSVLLIAAGKRMMTHGDVVQIATFLSAFWWIASVWLIVLFRRALHLELWQAFLLAGTRLVSGEVFTLGMEGFLLTFLVMLAFALFWSEWLAAAGACAALAFLARGEGALALPLLWSLVLAQAWTEKAQGKIDWKTLSIRIGRITAGFAIPAAAWSIYALHTFGSILPNTLQAKMAQGRMGSFAPFLHTLFTTDVPWWERQFSPPHWPVLNFWWLLVLIGLIELFQHHRRWLFFPAWAALYLMGYTVLRVPYYPWYNIPLRFVCILLSGFGLIGVVEGILHLGKSHRLAMRWLSAALAGAVLLGLLYPRIGQMRHAQVDARQVSYRRICNWLDQNGRDNESVAFAEVGFLAYFSNRPIVDLCGLTDPDIASHLSHGDFAWGFYHRRPDYYIYSAPFDALFKGIRSAPQFDRIYKPLATFPGPSQYDLVLYGKRNRPTLMFNAP